MDQARYQRLRIAVESALEVTPDARDALLVESCGGDYELLQEARQLIALALESDAKPELAIAIALNIPDLTGRMVGTCRVVRLLGEGGMGTVYLAEQQAPLKRLVALKIVKLGLDTREVMARFAAERQALALMNHPNIARVLEAGSTDEGRPYFVMEYIEGLPLTSYCRERQLDVQSRLELFIQVCRGIEHAHQRGVIHRDIKPGNILVAEQDGHAVPKIIDFGVAKAVGQEQVLQTAFTIHGLTIGTPEYMSPEQADPLAVDVDTRSDVYALGVVLYELITGEPPLPRKTLLRFGWSRIADALRDTVPDLPSVRLAAIATDATGATHRSVRGDLDWITMRALEKERDRRYGSSMALADDLERHLANLPVSAGPPSGRYLFGKFVRRHRAKVAVGTVLMISLLAAVFGTSLGMIQARRAQRASRAAESHATASALFLASNLAAIEDPSLALPYTVSALEHEDKPRYRNYAQRLFLRSPPLIQIPNDAHSGYIFPIDFSPDGRWLAMGTNTAPGRLYEINLDTGDTLQVDAGERIVYTLRFSADSSAMLVVSWDSTVSIWRPGARRPMHTAKLPGFCPHAFWGGNPQRVFTATPVVGRSMVWHEWRPGVGEPVELGETGPVIEMAAQYESPSVDPSGRWALVPIADRVDQYDLGNLGAGAVRTVARHPGRVLGCVVSPDARNLLVFEEDSGRAAIWDLKGDATAPLRWLKCATTPIIPRFDITGRRVVIPGVGGTQFWDLDLPTSAAPISARGTWWTFGAAFSPDGNWLVTSGQPEFLGAWPLGGARPIKFVLPATRRSVVAFSPDGSWLVTATDAGCVLAWPLAGSRIGEARVLFENSEISFSAIAFDDDGSRAYLTSCDVGIAPDLVLRVDLHSGEAERWTGLFGCNLIVDAQGRYVAGNASVPFGQMEARVIDTNSGLTWDLDRDWGGEAGAATRAVGFLADGRLLASRDDTLLCGSPAGGDVTILAVNRSNVILAEDRRTILNIPEDGPMSRGFWDATKLDTLSLAFAEHPASRIAADTLALTIAAASPGIGAVEVLDIPHGWHHKLPLIEATDTSVALDRKGRWLAVAAGSELTLMPMPLERPWEDEPLDSLLTRLRRFTNLHVVESPGSSSGFDLTGAVMPDWRNPPR